jgi:hypothetical protein
VGLLGVDQSVLLLKKGNDIEKSNVFEELDKYNEKTRFNRRWYGGYYPTYTDFDSSGAVVVTNAMEELRELNIFWLIKFSWKFSNKLINIKHMLQSKS